MSNHEKELPPLPAIVIGSTDASAVSLPVPDEGLSRGLGVPPVESPYLSVRSFGTPSPMFGNSAVSSTNATSLEDHGAKDVPVAVPMSEAPRSPRPAHAQPPQVPVLSAQQNVSKMDGVPSAPPGLPRKRLQPPSLLMNGGTGYHQPPPSPAPSRQNPIPLSDSTTEPLNLAPRELPDWDGRPQFTDGRFTYVFLSKLGTGGSAAVYAARVIPNELASIKIGFPLYVAVKVFWKAALELVRSDFKTAVSEKKILRELAENTLSLHTSKLLSSFQTERWLLFVMELHSGTSGYLAQFNHDNGPIMGMRNVLRYAAELLVGVEEFHNLGVVHGDLKPENILLTTSGHLVVSDFGSAYQHPEGRRAQLWNATATGSFPFTTCYAAPEVLDLSQFQATGYTSQVDLWSCGVIIAEWSLGLPKNVSLFDNYFDTRGSTSPSSKMLEHLETWEWETDHRGFSCIPFHLNDLLSKLLRKDPKERITLPEAMAHPFFADIDWNAIRSRRWEAPVSRELPTRMLSCRMEDLVNQRKLKSYDPMPDDIDWSVFNWPGIH
ncbi:kinase-like protein [Artomyces pyxidatus]|uniref:Kinase-like protein n=1 Tax=Artomyces pyxidatus TaxID=48021 RepID=A0ACB8THQ8_9AGAM|nr:kinase-like protein [Artomyces pyxidatus]